MTTTIWAVLLLVALIGLAYKKANLQMSAIATAVIAAIAFFSDAATGFVVTAAIFTAVFGVLSLSGFRANTITRPIFAIYKKILRELIIFLSARIGGDMSTSLFQKNIWRRH